MSSAASTAARAPRIAFVGPWDRLIWSARRGLVKMMIDRGWDVLTVSPVVSGGVYRRRLEELGARHVEVPVSRFIDPLGDLRYLWTLFRQLRRERPDLVHVFTVKPNVYGAFAARLAGVRRVVGLVEGLGFLYETFAGRLLLFGLLRFAFLWCDRVWFLNRDDRAECVQRRVLPARKAVLIPSVGVDRAVLESRLSGEAHLTALRAEFASEGTSRLVVCVGRMTWSKGVRELVDASALLARSHPDTKVLLVGEIQQGSPGSIPREYLEGARSRAFQWLGFRDDVPDLMRIADVITLPTHYREGVPLVLLEGMALGKPLVATDWVGCREVVRHGHNGLLVPVHDAPALAEAISVILSDPELAKRMGDAGRRMADAEFAEHAVNTRVVRELYREDG